MDCIFVLGAIEVTIATMSKFNRCSTDEVYVVGFVPSYLLPNKRPISLDPFIEPLIADIEIGFIHGIKLCSVAFLHHFYFVLMVVIEISSALYPGIKVNYPIDIGGIKAGNAIIRHLLLCWTGDHNGQCEVGKIIKCGQCPCRRCKLKGSTLHFLHDGY